MKILIELQYLGSVEYYAKLLQYDDIVLERHENFVKSSARNRCYIVGANGKLRLSIPLQNGRDQKKIYAEIKTENIQRWRAIHWHSIVSAYKHAPYFEHYAHFFEPFYVANKEENLFDWNWQLFQLSMKLLKAKQQIFFTEEYHKIVDETVEDYRNKIYGNETEFPKYYQVFQEKNGFIANLSVIDLLFNLGNEAKPYLLSLR
jgi:hypothetical protein